VSARGRAAPPQRDAALTRRRRAAQFGGYVVFRLSNLEKNRFRANPNDPKVAHLQYLTTESGSRLITSGWWGAARHINYLGDWLMGLAQSLACGIASPVPFFFPLYFAILLIHRERRDDHKCALKYGRDWRKYCELVPYRIVPYVY
jgi:steroid 5-alpha reductase family enzyme